MLNINQNTTAVYPGTPLNISDSLLGTIPSLANTIYPHGSFFDKCVDNLTDPTNALTSIFITWEGYFWQKNKMMALKVGMIWATMGHIVPIVVGTLTKQAVLEQIINLSPGNVGAVCDQYMPSVLKIIGMFTLSKFVAQRLMGFEGRDTMEHSIKQLFLLQSSIHSQKSLSGMMQFVSSYF